MTNSMCELEHDLKACKLHLEASVASGAEPGRCCGVLVGLLVPTGHARQLCWALDFLIGDRRVVPLEASEILAACFEDRVNKSITITVFVRILTVNHPSSAGLRGHKRFLFLIRIAPVVEASTSPVEARSCDIEMSSAISTDWVPRRAVVGTFQDKGSLNFLEAGYVGASGHSPALTAAFCKPAATAKSLRDGCSSIELGAVRIVCWSLEHGIRAAMNWIRSVSEGTATSAATAIPVSGSRCDALMADDETFILYFSGVGILTVVCASICWLLSVFLVALLEVKLTHV